MLSQYDTQPMMNVYASVEGRDLGGVDADIQKVLADFQSKLPRGTQLCPPRAGRDHDFVFRRA